MAGFASLRGTAQLKWVACTDALAMTFPASDPVALDPPTA
jgi:hypothetical protein